MSKNRAGGVYHTNMEWGDKARKEEDRNRGLNNTARKDSLKEWLETHDASDWREWVRENAEGGMFHVDL